MSYTINSIIALTLLSGCGHIISSRLPEIDTYLQRFQEYTGGDTDHVGFSVRPLSDSLLGQYRITDDNKNIYFNSLYWSDLSSVEKEFLVYHEVLHYYKKRHVEGYLADGCPAHIMAPYLPIQECLETHYDLYTNQVKAYAPLREVTP